MKSLSIIFFFYILFTFQSCKQKPEKIILLTADREAPLGWVHLNIYEDKSFEFISSGIRKDVIYPGTVRISTDTLYFEYAGKTPKAGKVAVIENNFITYIKGSYRENLEIKSNHLTNK